MFTALRVVGATFEHIAFVMMIGGVIRKEGMFISSQNDEKVSISFANKTQGAAYYYIIVYFLIWGVENNRFKVPGLEVEENAFGESNLAKVKVVALKMLQDCSAGLPEDRLPENHYYDGYDFSEEGDGEQAVVTFFGETPEQGAPGTPNLTNADV